MPNKSEVTVFLDLAGINAKIIERIIQSNYFDNILKLYLNLYCNLAHRNPLKGNSLFEFYNTFRNFHSCLGKNIHMRCKHLFELPHT